MSAEEQEEKKMKHFSLEQRRKMRDLTMLYKLMSGTDKVDRKDLMERAKERAERTHQDAENGNMPGRQQAQLSSQIN